jgi:hypothetical protein
LDIAPGADTHVVGSVAERAVVERLLSNHRIEAVVHKGALHKPNIARYPGRASIDVNVTGTLNLLEAAVAAGHDRFVFTSTTSLMVSHTSVKRLARLQAQPRLPIDKRSFGAVAFRLFGGIGFNLMAAAASQDEARTGQPRPSMSINRLASNALGLPGPRARIRDLCVSRAGTASRPTFGVTGGSARVSCAG